MLPTRGDPGRPSALGSIGLALVTLIEFSELEHLGRLHDFEVDSGRTRLRWPFWGLLTLWAWIPPIIPTLKKPNYSPYCFTYTDDEIIIVKLEDEDENTHCRSEVQSNSRLNPPLPCPVYPLAARSEINRQPAMFLSHILRRLGAVALMGLAALPALSSAAYADPGACSGYCWTHDPAVVKRASDGTYFRFATGGGIQVAKATSLSGSWTFEGEALPSGSSIALSGNTDLWVSEAPVAKAKSHFSFVLTKSRPRWLFWWDQHTTCTTPSAHSARKALPSATQPPPPWK